MFYANTKEAYHSLPLPPLGRADHNLVHLLPVYKTLVHRQPAVTRTVKKWSEEAEEALKDCFNTTLWDVFSDAHGEDIDSLTHCLTDYINFCVENTVPTRTVRSFSNSKPWITPDIKALLKEKRRAFVSGNKEELKSVQRELRRMIRKGKRTATGGRWSTSCSRTTSVVSGRDLRPSRASRSQSPSLWETRGGQMT
ncbi:hypothetical protein L3Q82_007044 [Scortum barcoo]|uniref:Uncharacterized protein n=1 Tax=Scortum barcoo TaxID=214431 RepID=A0ACB8WW06_9TELE|nr:hypothetical protein L3Q82_007044 [Scortum barcoo]